MPRAKKNAAEAAVVVKTATPEYSAEIQIDHEFHYEGEHKKLLRGYPENLGYVAYGYIFNDTATHGNHPFNDGDWIHTSLAVREEIVDGVKYLHTLNTVYKVRG